MDPFNNISMDVRQLISINEKLNSTVLRGRALTHDETEIVRQCATQLMELTHHTGVKSDPAEKVAPLSSNGTI